MGPATGGKTTCVPVRLMNPHPVEVVVYKSGSGRATEYYSNHGSA